MKGGDISGGGPIWGAIPQFSAGTNENGETSGSE
jgi:hypothetical protein